VLRPLAFALGLMLAAVTVSTRAQDAAILIELPNGVLPNAVGGGGSVVVGGLAEGGGFYWMPTTGVVYMGGQDAIDVSRDGRTIVGRASIRAGFTKLGSGSARPSGGCSARSPPTPRRATTC
jgi:hypothetical protein